MVASDAYNTPIIHQKRGIKVASFVEKGLAKKKSLPTPTTNASLSQKKGGGGGRKSGGFVVGCGLLGREKGLERQTHQGKKELPGGGRII